MTFIIHPIPMEGRPNPCQTKIRALISASHLQFNDSRFRTLIAFIRDVYGDPITFFHAAGSHFQFQYDPYSSRFFKLNETSEKGTVLSKVYASAFESNIDEHEWRLPADPFTACLQMIKVSRPHVLIAVKGEPWTRYLQFLAVSQDLPIVTFNPEQVGDRDDVIRYRID